MSSITLTVSSNSSQLFAEYFPPIDISDGDYVCGLIDFQTFNAIPNIDEKNNLFHFNVSKDMKRRIHAEELAALQSLYGEEKDKYFGKVIEESANANSKTQIENNVQSTPKMISDAKFQLAEKNLLQSLTNELLDKFEVIEIPTGTYEIEQIAQYLKKSLDKFNVNFDLIANKSTLKSEMFCSESIDFSEPKSIGSLFGFEAKKYDGEVSHISELAANTFKVNIIRVECDLIYGAYINNTPVHTIHQFSPRVPPGYKIVEVPNKVIYFPVSVKSISSLNISLVDQDNNLINFRGETITIRVHLKKVK